MKVKYHIIYRNRNKYPISAMCKFFKVSRSGYHDFIKGRSKRFAGNFELTKEFSITPSMPSKGNPYDDAMAENFFSILKTECIYRHKPKILYEANEMIDGYIHFYNHGRIQVKTRSGAADAAPLRLKLNISYIGVLFVLSIQTGVFSIILVLRNEVQFKSPIGGY